MRADTAGSAAHADHPAGVRQAYERLLAGTPVRTRYLEVGAGNRVHLLETGTGPPLVLLHGGGGSGGFFLPLLKELRGIGALAPDRPGQGLSDPIDLPREHYRENVVVWMDALLDTLKLDTTSLLGHSGGAMWALWYALARPDRIRRLVLIGPPGVPNTHCPLLIRLAATPSLGELVSRLVPPSPKSVLQFAHHAAREKGTLARYPDLVDLFVATFADPIADRVAVAEERVFVSPFALVTRSGMRRSARIRPDELRSVAMPTLLIWGEQEPLGSVSVAQRVVELIPRARLQVLAGGHGPWLGQPVETAAAVADFVCDKEPSE